MWNAVFEIFVGNRLEAERAIEFLQMALSAKLDRRTRKTGLRKFDGLFHQTLAELVAPVIRRHDDASDLHRLAILFRRQNPQRRCKLFPVENAQVKCLEILAVNLRIGTFLFDHEDIHAQLQHRIKCARGQVVELVPPGNEKLFSHQ